MGVLVLLLAGVLGVLGLPQGPGVPQQQQEIEVLSHICKYGVHPGGRR